MYEPAPAVFATQLLSCMPDWSIDDSLYAFTYAPPAWWSSVKSKLDELGKLPSNWNSYGGKPIAPSARSAALDLLRQIASRKTPQPAIVPTSDGSIQIEWHMRGIDLEVRVLSPTRIGVSFDDAQNQAASIDDEFQYDFRPLVKAINILSSR